MSPRDYTHERIHSAQYRELGYLLFLPLYLIEWMIKLCYYRFDNKKAYRAISFEREAYRQERNPEYLKQRKHYAWLGMLKEKTT